MNIVNEMKFVIFSISFDKVSDFDKIYLTDLYKSKVENFWPKSHSWKNSWKLQTLLKNVNKSKKVDGFGEILKYRRHPGFIRLGQGLDQAWKSHVAWF